VTSDDATRRTHIQERADAVVRGDTDEVVSHFSEELRPGAPEIVQALPQPVTAAEVLSGEIGDDECIAMIRYSGEDQAVTVRSRREFGGRPLIVHAEPAG